MSSGVSQFTTVSAFATMDVANREVKKAKDSSPDRRVGNWVNPRRAFWETALSPPARYGDPFLTLFVIWCHVIGNVRHLLAAKAGSRSAIRSRRSTCGSATGRSDAELTEFACSALRTRATAMPGRESPEFSLMGVERVETVVRRPSYIERLLHQIGHSDPWS